MEWFASTVLVQQDSIVSWDLRWASFSFQCSYLTQVLCAIQYIYSYICYQSLQGNLEFDMKAETLRIKVKPQKADSTMTKQVDTSSLSGGEKSFSTVCFILALWQEAALPFHFLDEFDVFMVSTHVLCCGVTYAWWTWTSLCPLPPEKTQFQSSNFKRSENKF